MISAHRFWSRYFIASMVSVSVTLLFFRMTLLYFDWSYESATIFAACVAMPINWMTGEQLTWQLDVSRKIRALRYFLVYTTGLLIEVFGVHVFGHILFFNPHVANALAVCMSTAFTGPMNHLWIWSDSIQRKVSTHVKRNRLFFR